MTEKRERGKRGKRRIEGERGRRCEGERRQKVEKGETWWRGKRMLLRHLVMLVALAQVTETMYFFCCRKFEKWDILLSLTTGV